MTTSATESLIVAVNLWQIRDDIHPLTCGNDSSHEILVPCALPDGSVRLECLNCTYRQPLSGTPLAAFLLAERERRDVLDRPKAAPEETCGNCRFFHSLKGWEDRIHSFCRRFPPQQADDSLFSAFPTTSEPQWCGEWHRAPDKPTIQVL